MSYGRVYTKKVTIDGIVFDSEMEWLYYQHLKELEKANLVKDVRIHPSYTLLNEFVNGNGKKHKAITYEPDFVFYDMELSKQRFVDVKGMLFDDFKLKWKMFDQWLADNCKGCYLEVIKYSKTTGFVPFEDYKKIMKSKRSQLIDEKNYYKNELLKIEKNKAKEEKERNRIKELKSLPKLTKAQEKRLKELEAKYV